MNNKVVNAGLYLLNYIEEAVKKASSLLKSEILKAKLNQINNSDKLIDIANIVIKEYNLNTRISGKYKSLKLFTENLYPLKNRFSNYNTLNIEQTLEKINFLQKLLYLKNMGI